jgi:hypothetical protein
MIIDAHPSVPPLSLRQLEEFDPRARSGGAEQRFLCPLCGDGKPKDAAHRSLSTNTRTSAWHCHRCGASGKLRDFWQERPMQGQRERTRLALRRAFAIDAAAPRTAPETAATWREVFDSSVRVAGTEGAEYLAGRGIPEAAASAAGVRYLQSLYRRPAVVFPFLDQSGVPCAFQARHSDGKPDGHRALGPRSDGVFLTAPYALQAQTVIVCEAPADALSLAACGLDAVALGCTEAPAWLPVALGFRRALLGFDNDANGAGDLAARKLAPALQSFGAKVARLRPYRAPGESKSDWNTMLQHYGPDALGCWLRAGLHHIARFDFRLDTTPGQRWPFAWCENINV